MSDDLKKNLSNEDTWKRGLFMLLYVICYAAAEGLATTVMLLQFVWVLCTGEPNPRLTEFGAALASYFQQIVSYVTWNHENKPWPVGEWPKIER